MSSLSPTKSTSASSSPTKSSSQATPASPSKLSTSTSTPATSSHATAATTSSPTSPSVKTGAANSSAKVLPRVGSGQFMHPFDESTGVDAGKDGSAKKAPTSPLASDVTTAAALPALVTTAATSTVDSPSAADSSSMDSPGTRQKNSLLNRLTSGLRNRVMSNSSLDGKKGKTDSKESVRVGSTDSVKSPTDKKRTGSSRQDIARSAPLKSILKKSGSALAVDVQIASGDGIGGSQRELSTQFKELTVTTTGGANEPSRLGVPSGNGTLQRSPHSAPDLNAANGDPGAHALRPSLTQGAIDGNRLAVQQSLSRAGSSKKQLSFSTENTNIVDTYSRDEYNRKPPPNMTFHKLDNKLRMEIREELNAYKMNEMKVHKDSVQNTVIH